jgi:AAA+ ATPase superfamily predicted ATPase
VNIILTANVNIWAIEKDNSIKLLLLLLTDALSSDDFQISDNKQLDSRSVRIFNKDDELMSAYVYTYGQMENRYGLHLEFPFHDELDISSSMDIYEALSFKSLVELLCVHFDLTF